MNRHWRLVCVVAMLTVANPWPQALAATQPTVRAPTSQSAVWPHERSDLPVDKELRFGILPNGMRYVIRNNLRPPNGASLRLRIDAGSIHEAEDQRGVAHFLEHLALNETHNLPEGELMRRLERAGLQMGPDTNAETGFEQTVYKLDLPQTDEETVATALLVLREVAGEATFRAEVVDRERGVVLAEGRSRQSPMVRVAEVELEQHFAGDRLAERLPIGLSEVIRTVTPQRINDFYRAYYRPERATLVAIGAFDVDEMEAKIRAQFGDWTGRGPAPAALSPLAAPAAGLRAATLVAPDAPHSVVMSWSAPRDRALDTRASRARAVHQVLALSVFNERLERAATGTEEPFIGGQANWERIANRAELYRLTAVASPGGLERALQGLEQEQRRVLEHGFSAEEIARTASEMRAAIVERNGSIDIADRMVAFLNEDVVFTTADFELELFDAVIAGTSPEQVTSAFRELSAGREPLILTTAPQAALSEAATRSAWAAGRAVPVVAPTGRQAASWPYETFGKPGEVAERRQIDAIGATSIRFRNGVRLIVKPTTFARNVLIASVQFAGGMMSAPARGSNAAWSVPFQSFTAGGTGTLDAAQIRMILAGRDIQVAEGLEEDKFTLQATTATENLGLQLQLLAGYATDPGFRANSWNRVRALSGTLQDQFEASAAGILQRDLPSLLRDGDPRWAIPDREEMAAMPATALSDLLRGSLSNAPISLVIVGDVDVDEAVREVAATFGALPPRAALASAATPYRFPAPGRVTRMHRGPADQGFGLIAWKTAGYYGDRPRMLGLTLLARVFELRLTQELRERQGASYAPGAGVDESRTLADYGYFYAAVEVPPQAVDGFFSDAEAIARSLRERPIEADELERARRPLLEQMNRDRVSNNGWWLAHLNSAGDDPDRVTGMVEAPRVVSEVTAADLQRLAQTYLTEGGAWQLAVLPQTR